MLAYLAKRIEKLRGNMKKENIQTVIIEKPENVMYYSSFNPIIYSMPVFFIFDVDNEPCLLVHALRAAHAREESALDNIQVYGQWGNNKPVAVDMIDAAKSILGETKVNRLGLELDYLSVDTYRKLVKKIAPREIISVTDLVCRQKIEKDSWEIQQIRKAAELTDYGFVQTLEALTKGCSEAEASTEGQYAMRKLWQEKFSDAEVAAYGTAGGGKVDSLQVWCLSNEHIAYGCDCPRNYYPKNGDLTLPMVWATVNGYHAETERTVMVGNIDAFKQHAYDSMLKAREAIFKILKPGIAAKDVYRAASNVYEQNGFGQILPGRVGHGVGCTAHDLPSLTMNNELILEPGMVFTVEPGIMDSTWGGVRHSDTVLMTETGYEVLTKVDSGSIKISIQ